MRLIHPGIITQIIGTSPGPASGISYEVEFDRGKGPVRQNFDPKGARLPDEINTVAAPVGTPVIIQESQGLLTLSAPGESFEIEECEEPAP